MKRRFSRQADEASKDLGLALEATEMLWEGRDSGPACIPYRGQPFARDMRNMNETWSPAHRPGHRNSDAYRRLQHVMLARTERQAAGVKRPVLPVGPQLRSRVE